MLAAVFLEAAELAAAGPAADIRPGLLAAYRSLLEPAAALSRVDAKPAFYLPAGASIHPRLSPGPFEASWIGLILIDDEGPISFDAFACGELQMDVDGAVVIDGRSDVEPGRIAPHAPLEREPGRWPVRIRYRAREGRPARVQLGWEGPGFSREPIPAWRFHHAAETLPPAALEAERIEAGREAAARLGCAHCHARSFPGPVPSLPGPSLTGIGSRIRRQWLRRWLEEPSRVRPGARMPVLFPPGRVGAVERWIVAEGLLGGAGPGGAEEEDGGDHRTGRRLFVSVGCAACHFLPDAEVEGQAGLGRTALASLGDRLPAGELAAFLRDPGRRYPDGRMPRIPLSLEEARAVAAFLLLWSRPAAAGDESEPPAPGEIEAVSLRLGVKGIPETAAALLREKRCSSCHPGLEEHASGGLPIAVRAGAGGCLSGQTLPRFTIDASTRTVLSAWLGAAGDERHRSDFEERRRLLERAGCARCHQRDTDRPPPIEEVGSSLGGAWLQKLPFQRTPRLTHPHRKLARSYILSAVQDGVSGLRPADYSYRMPAYGPEAEAIERALAEGDGEPPAGDDGPGRTVEDPTLATLHGPTLTGFQGYACVACHLWNGKLLADPDPGAVGTDLTRVSGRIRRDWFDRFLEGPARFHPGTPMPAYFPRGGAASLGGVLGGEAAKQKDALWAYLSLGKDAPPPGPPPLLAVNGPAPGEPPLVAHVPVRLAGGTAVDGICILYSSHDLILYDLAARAPVSFYTGARILRSVQGRLRTYSISGNQHACGPGPDSKFELSVPGGRVEPLAFSFRGYDRLADGVRIRLRAEVAPGAVDLAETLRLAGEGTSRALVQEMSFSGLPRGASLVVTKKQGSAGFHGEKEGRVLLEVPAGACAPKDPTPLERAAFTDPAKAEGSLERPGYRAIALPRPRTLSGEDLILPSALAVDPRDGRLFVASMKLGELFVLRETEGEPARFVDYARGLFQESYSMLAADGALYVLHRGNLTRIADTDGDGFADRFDRAAALPQAVADAYDYAYGLVRDPTGAFVISHAPHASHGLRGSGGVLRLPPDGRSEPEEVAFGLRNPLGWCSGPDGEVFFTDNQGEWVAANKLCHVVKGRFYGYPNPEQRQHAERPAGKAAVWVPYAWAKSINGVAYDGTGGKFGPFQGQFFLAELMFGGAIVRAAVEQVNGQYQGACFPFWGKGLLGPLTLAFDPRGRLYVGSITEPGWMGQPDRGAVYRIELTGETPFEMRSIHALQHGFRIIFTAPVSPESASDPASFHVEHYRYEYTGAYGSPELERTAAAVERATVEAGGSSLELRLPPLVPDRVYRITARGVRSARGEPLVHPTGAYTLNEVPGDR